MALEALIFDVDGTLANTERDGHLVAFNEAFKELGLDWFASTFAGVVGGAIANLKPALRASLNKRATQSILTFP
jgi:phosphoglycolate phosphatase-like HAD superfamily hydrolase